MSVDMINLHLLYFLYIIFRSLLNILHHHVSDPDPHTMAQSQTTEPTNTTTNIKPDQTLKWLPDSTHTIRLHANTAYVIIGNPEGIARLLCPSLLAWGADAGALIFLIKDRNPSPAGSAVLNSLRDAGAKLQVYTDCLSSAARLSTVLSLWSTDGWRVGGIIHDRTMQTTTTTDSLLTSITEATILHEVTAPMSLDFLAAFSAASAHSSAVDVIAQHRASYGLPFVAVDIHSGGENSAGGGINYPDQEVLVSLLKSAVLHPVRTEDSCQVTVQACGEKGQLQLRLQQEEERAKEEKEEEEEEEEDPSIPARRISSSTISSVDSRSSISGSSGSVSSVSTPPSPASPKQVPIDPDTDTDTNTDTKPNITVKPTELPSVTAPDTTPPELNPNPTPTVEENTLPSTLQKATTLAAATESMSAEMQAKMARLLGTDEEDIETDVPLSAIGVDSLIAATFCNWLETEAKATVGTFELLEAKSLRGLAGDVVRRSSNAVVEREIDSPFLHIHSITPHPYHSLYSHISPQTKPNQPCPPQPPPINIGIKALEIYFPPTSIPQTTLETHLHAPTGKHTLGHGQTSMAIPSDHDDTASLALTTLSTLLTNHHIPPTSIGRLEVATESPPDRSKSIKTLLMPLLAPNTNVEGADTTNACYGGTSALFNSVAWIESSAWDGRDAVVVAGDIA
ncbi:hypothetical protein BO70DRAFT_381679, partial [Aspergillus heteromorphus CBS 117.55]